MSTGAARGSAALAIALVLAVGAAGCGAPAPGSTRSVPAEDVPYRLLDPASTAEPRPSPTSTRQANPQLFLLGAEDLLVPVPSSVDAGGLRPVLRRLLAQLAAGPTEQQRQAGLASALGPEIELRLVGVSGSTATVDLVLPRDPAADRLALAVGQVVLSLTSVTGVESVRLVQGGQLLEAPLPGGSRTSGAVTEQDYLPLTVGGQVPVPKADPSPTDPGPSPDAVTVPSD